MVGVGKLFAWISTQPTTPKLMGWRSGSTAHVLTSMLAKTVERGGKDWDQLLAFVLFHPATVHTRVTFLSPVWKRPQIAY